MALVRRSTLHQAPPRLAAPRRLRAAAAAGAARGGGRRAALGALAAALGAAAGAGRASCAPRPRGDVCSYDCEVGDEECLERRSACRRKALSDSSSASGFDPNAQMATERVGGVNLKGKTASQTDAYVAETNELLAVVKETLSLDPFDPKRPVNVKAIQKDGGAWTARYAPGGSYTLASAGKVYQAVDTLLGWFAAEGLRPPSPKIVRDVNAQMAEGEALLGKGQ